MKVRSLLIRGVFASILLTGCANSEGVLCRLDQEILWILRSANEHGFLNENYYVFICTYGGRNSFTTRDYCVVLDVRKQRIAKIFRSRLRFLSGGWPISMNDFALSADEKYFAIRYEDEITIHRFSSESDEISNQKN